MTEPVAAPAEPFLLVTMSAGYTADSLHALSAWLQSDAVRGMRDRPTKLALGLDVAALLSDPASYKALASDADPELFPTGPRTSPRDDIIFPVDKAYEGPALDAVWLLRQSPPGDEVTVESLPDEEGVT